MFYKYLTSESTCSYIIFYTIYNRLKMYDYPTLKQTVISEANINNLNMFCENSDYFRPL